MDDEERAREEREQVVNPNRFANAPKPEEYDDAPQWQKDAWDSDPKLVAGCLCGKTTVECGDCYGLVAHQEETLQKTGWVAPSETIYAFPDVQYSPEFPAISVIRGGILYPRFVVETQVLKARKRFLRRQTWNLHICYYDVSQKRFMNHIMEGFPAESLAVNAAEVMRFMMMNINEQYHEEKRRDRETTR